MRGQAFSPGHVTGIFAGVNNKDVLRSGSVGVGVNIGLGVSTFVKIEQNCRYSCEVRINGVKRNDAYTSHHVVKKAAELVKRPFKIQVDHNTPLPMGAGFGTSGAGALGLSLVINNIMELGLSRIDAAKLAHEADFLNKTGLGTVTAELCGGLEMRTSAGAPGVSVASKIPSRKGLTLVSMVYGPISTSRMLSNELINRKINIISKPLLAALRDNPTANLLMKNSSEFTKKIGLASPHLKMVLEKLESIGYQAGMTMFGEGIFTLVKENEILELCKKLDSLESRGMIILSRVDSQGAFVY